MINVTFSELRRSTEWTSWARVNETREGRVERRYRVVCKANVPQQTDLKVQVKTNERFCASGSDDQCAGEALLHDLEGGDLDLLHVPADLRPLLDLLSTALCGGSSTFVDNRPHCLHTTYSCYRGKHIQLHDSLDGLPVTLPPIGGDHNKQADVSSSNKNKDTAHHNRNDSEQNGSNKLKEGQEGRNDRKTLKEDSPSEENELIPKRQRDSIDSVTPKTSKRQFRKPRKNRKYGPPWSDYQAFTGYCKCRNLGNIRMCYRCKSPFL